MQEASELPEWKIKNTISRLQFYKMKCIQQFLEHHQIPYLSIKTLLEHYPNGLNRFLLNVMKFFESIPSIKNFIEQNLDPLDVSLDKLIP